MTLARRFLHNYQAVPDAYVLCLFYLSASGKHKADCRNMAANYYKAFEVEYGQRLKSCPLLQDLFDEGTFDAGDGV
jgi:hypothetical protein